LLCALALVFSARSALASEGRTAAEALDQAERDDAALKLGKAADEYEEALRLDPTMRDRMRAEQRASAIRLRAEDDFLPLAALERVRRDPVLASDESTIDELVHASQGFPPGLVRVEVWMLAAEAYDKRLGRASDAATLWRLVAADPRADSVTVQSALRSLAMYHLARGDYAGAKAVISMPRANAAALDRGLERDVGRAILRHHLHDASVLALGALFLFAGASFFGRWRAGRLRDVLTRAGRTSVLPLAYAAYVAIAGALLAQTYEGGTARPFLLFGLALAPLLLLARAWSLAGSPARWARALRAGLCMTSTLGVAFLVLERVNVAYLESIGL
jgi:hypothetical protein